MSKAIARILLVALAAVVACSDERSASLGPVVIGVRKGEQDAVQPVDEVAAGSRMDLAAALSVRAGGWVHATWTYWNGKSGIPTVRGTKSFNPAGPATLFTHLDGSTSFGGWEEGIYTCDFKNAAGQTIAGRIRVVARQP